MRVDLFDFELPQERIALRPVRPRDAARMLVARGKDTPFQDAGVLDLPNLLEPGDCLVFNDTRARHDHCQLNVICDLTSARHFGGST